MTRSQFDAIEEAVVQSFDPPEQQVLVDALRQLYESSQWQPIDTAPEGCEVLAYEGAAIKILELVSIGSGWWDYESSGHKPTHWRPLPEPPES